jgi:aryl sulfotransferase
MSVALQLRPHDHRSAPLPAEWRRIYRNSIVDSANWDHLPLKAKDIVISTAAPGGAGWMQDILLRLARRGRPGQMFSPWVDQAGADLAVMAKMLDAVTHRRVLTSHLPLDGLPFREDLSYVVVVHDPRDVFMSLCDREADLPDDARTSFDDWLATDPFHHIASWWDHRRLENIHFVHACDLLGDAVTEIAALAEHIGLGLRLSQARAIAAETTFSANRRRGPGESGRAGRWKGALTEEELQCFEAAKWHTLVPACASFLERGRRALW